jgi:hypothetical protein
MIVDKGVVTNEKYRRDRQTLARLGSLHLVVELDRRLIRRLDSLRPDPCE